MHQGLSIIIPVRNEKFSLPIIVRLLNSTIKFNKEIIIVYDSKKDSSIQPGKILIKEFKNVKLIHNKNKKGVKFAINAGIQNAKYELILITTSDELFPIISIDKMLSFFNKKKLDLLSGTRYSKGGFRLGGSLVGHIFSKTNSETIQYVFE